MLDIPVWIVWIHGGISFIRCVVMALNSMLLRMIVRSWALAVYKVMYVVMARRKGYMVVWVGGCVECGVIGCSQFCDNKKVLFRV